MQRVRNSILHKKYKIGENLIHTLEIIRNMHVLPAPHMPAHTLERQTDR